jgi:hypothetical protein
LRRRLKLLFFEFFTAFESTVGNDHADTLADVV